MHISLVGTNYQTAPLAIREKVAITTYKLDDYLELLHKYIPHGVILSTCNRTEVYTVDHAVRDTYDAVMRFFQESLNLNNSILPLYQLENEQAVEHLYRVAAGLESMIVGEYEVLGQVKQALRKAEKIGIVNLPLRYIFQSAIHTGRRVRRETEISQNALSVSSLALEMAIKKVPDFNNCKLLVIGAGDAGRLVAKIALDRGIRQLTVAGRTMKRAKAITSKIGGKPVDLNNLPEELDNSKIIITCSGAPHRLLDFHRVASIMKSRSENPLVIIDIGMPRNVDPDVSLIGNVYLYNIDDLIQLSETNRLKREGEVIKAEEIISDEMCKFSQWQHNFEVRPLIKSIMNKGKIIRSYQLNRTLRKLPQLSDEERDRLEAMTKTIVNKILEHPIHYLKNNNNNNNNHDIIKELFQLNKDD